MPGGDAAGISQHQLAMHQPGIGLAKHWLLLKDGTKKEWTRSRWNLKPRNREAIVFEQLKQQKAPKQAACMHCRFASWWFAMTEQLML